MRISFSRVSVALSSLVVSFAFLSPVDAAVTARDVLIKAPGQGAAVYYLASDGKRYVFPSEKTYRTWFSDFSDITEVTLADLASFPIGGNVTYRPGIRMVKITTDPKVYVVDRGGVLRWIASEAVATALYGADWNTKIDDVPDAFFFSYLIGTSVTSVDDFHPSTAALAATTINADRSLGASAQARRSDTAPGGGIGAPVTGPVLTSFRFPDIDGGIGLINDTARTVRITVPYGTSLSALVARVGHTGASVSPADDIAQDFRNSVTYTVTAADGVTRAYVVTVTVAARSSKKSITSFSFINLSDTDGDIDEDERTIAVTVPHGTNLSSLVPRIVHDGVAISPDSSTARNFRNSVNYRVTAEDGTTQTYSVTATVAPPAYAKAITSFTFPSVSGAVGEIDEAAKTIEITVPYGTSRTSFAPTIVHDGASISPASGLSRNFSNPVTYTVTARDGSRQAYVVTVVVSPYRSSKSITSFSFPSLAGATGVINESARTIAVTVPYGTSRTSLTPTVVHSGASVSPASGTTRSFSNTVNYRVTAEDGTTQTYAVTVSVSPYRTAKAITSFRFNNLAGATGVMNESARTIAVTVPAGTDRTSLIPTVVFDGESVSPASGTARNFTNTVNYRVTAEDGSTRTYAVTVTVAP